METIKPAAQLRVEVLCPYLLGKSIEWKLELHRLHKEAELVPTC